MLVRQALGLPDTLAIYTATKPKGTDKQYITCPYDDAVGIEIEVENVTGDLLDRSTPPGWSMTDDGSLRNNGREFITKPTAANTIHWSLGRLMDGYLDQREQSFSPRTSTHVHVNCRDLEIDEVKNAIRFYALFERLLYRYCGKSRYKNIYCVPLIDTTLLSEMDGYFPNTRRWPKYAGLNAAPLTTYGTLEFRHMHGTFDVNRLVIWISMILSIVNYAKGKSNATVIEEILPCCDEQVFLTLMDRVFQGNRNQLMYKTVEDYYHGYTNALSSFVPARAMRMEAKSRLHERIAQCAAS